MSLSIDRFLRVRGIRSPAALASQDQSLAAYITDIRSDQFEKNLYLYAGSQREVELAFGTDSEIAKATSKAFGSNKKPRKVMIVYWNKLGVNIVARANALTATQTPVPILNIDSTYEFTIKSRNVTQTVVYTKADAATYEKLVIDLNKALGVASRFVFSYQNSVFTLASKVTGEDIDTDGIEMIGKLAEDLRLSINRQPKEVRGTAVAGGKKQTITDVISELEDKQPAYYGFYSSVELSDAEIEEAHDRLQSAIKPKFFALTIQKDYMLDRSQSNPIFKIAGRNTRILNAQLNKLGDKHAAVEYMVLACSTNWAARNSAQTMKFKTEQTVQVDENITESTASRCDFLGINYYTDYDGAAMLAEGRTVGLSFDFTDAKVGDDALINTVQILAATRLQSSPKIPQSDEGQVTLHSSMTPALEQFITNGFGARNQIWDGPEFGTLKRGARLPLGYYIYSDSYDTQSKADRDARKAMPTMIAFKRSGAIHDADVMVMLEG